MFEIKAGSVYIKDGKWLYGSDLPMTLSPFAQARRNKYALIEKLKISLKSQVDKLTITHAVWLPDLKWNSSVPDADAPSRRFLFDKTQLQNPESDLIALLKEANPHLEPWAVHPQKVLKDLLAPDRTVLVPLSTVVDDTNAALLIATEQQTHALRLLKSQSRVLVEGGAGTGKTLLAFAIAKEHAAKGKKVLLTCYNKSLAIHLAQCAAAEPNITIMHFHELVKKWVEKSGAQFTVPTDKTLLGGFFKDECPELLLTAADKVEQKFDTIIVDEAGDFQSTWWIALESIAQPTFSWYCFYDLQQTIYNDATQWVAPFKAEPFVLEENLRNTKPIGLIASELGHFATPAVFKVTEGVEPNIIACKDFESMGVELKKYLNHLIHHQDIKPDQIAILSPHAYTHTKAKWTLGLEGFAYKDSLLSTEVGKVRLSTIHSFKGLEADVVILVGLDSLGQVDPKLLYVGCSRAKVLLCVLALGSESKAS